MDTGGGAPSFEQAAEQIKQQAREKQDKVREDQTKTDQGVEHIQQKANALRKAITNIKGAIAKLQAQAQQNPQVKNHPMYYKRLNGLRSQLKEYEDALVVCESQLEKLRNRKVLLRNALIQIAGQASAQLAMVRKKQDTQKQQQQAQAAQQKKKGAKEEGGKVRG